MTAWAPGRSSSSGVAARVQKGWRPRPYHVKMKSTDLAPPRTIDRTGRAVKSLCESEVGRLHLDMIRRPERWTAAPGRANGLALLLLCSNTVAFSMKADATERHRTTTTIAQVALQRTAVHFRSVHRQLCCLSRRRARQTGVCNRVPVIRSGCQCGSSTHGDGQTDRSAQGNKNPPSKGVELQLHRSLLGGLPLVGPLGEACLRPLKRPPRVGPFDSGDRTWTTQWRLTSAKTPAPPIRSIRTSAKALWSLVFLHYEAAHPCRC